MKKLLYILFLLPFIANAQVSPPSGVQLPGPVIRNASTDGYPTGYADIINGGYHTGTSYHGRDSLSSTTNIPNYRGLLRPGMLYHVYNPGVVDSTYQWTGLVWLPVIYGTTYTFTNGVKAPGNAIQLDPTYSPSFPGVTLSSTPTTATGSQAALVRDASTGVIKQKTIVDETLQSVTNRDSVTNNNLKLDRTGKAGPTWFNIVNSGFQQNYGYQLAGINTLYKNTVGNTLYLHNNVDSIITDKLSYANSPAYAAKDSLMLTTKKYVQSLISGGGVGTVTSVSSINSDIGVATGTTTPVLTLNSGTGANQIPKRNGSGNLSIGIADLTATGTPSSTTYLRGDNTWAAVASGVTYQSNSSSVSLSKSTLNSTYSTAQHGWVVYLPNANLKYLKVDDSSSGNWNEEPYNPTL